MSSQIASRQDNRVVLGKLSDKRQATRCEHITKQWLSLLLSVELLIDIGEEYEVQHTEDAQFERRVLCFVIVVLWSVRDSNKQAHYQRASAAIE